MSANFKTYATETLDQTLGNVTIAANTSVETAQSVGYAASNASTFLTIVNTGTKALSLGYGVALTGELGHQQWMRLQPKIHILDACLVSGVV